MIKERYCSYELSKLLKEKGFDEPCLSYFWSEENNMEISYTDSPFTNKQLYSNQTLRPTHQMALDYLREEHNILIWFYPVIPVPIPKDKMVFYWEWKTKKKLHSYPHVHNHIKYETYEEAVEAALKYSLEKLV